MSVSLPSGDGPATTIRSRYHMEQAAREYCPAYEAIQVLQEKWTMHIVRSLLDGPKGFNELGRDIGGCNPATLNCRLQHLEGLGLVLRDVVSLMPPKTTYSLTTAGFELNLVIGAIDDWAQRNLPAAPADPCPEVEAAS